MAVTAAMVKTLRERTGAGMMDCKKALTETQGDLEAAALLMRKKGMAQADKRAGRTASEGRVVVARSACGSKATMIEINSETDFVARGSIFGDFSAAVVALALESSAASPEELAGMKLPSGQSVEQTRREVVARLGENITIRRLARVECQDGRVADYVHGVKIGVLVAIHSSDAQLGRDLAMHVAASKPWAVDESSVDPDTLAREREVFSDQAKQSGKPDEIVTKMVEGKIKKFLKEITLLSQPFVKNPDISVGQLIKANKARVLSFVRYELGEGMDKSSNTFVGEASRAAG